ncbi:MAG: helix-turn-helix transcriptional regulator [Oscillospiraceae bacterium]|nr:helix-turn-helix transcriptional regulator [Oscillospiraceae bacterium]
MGTMYGIIEQLCTERGIKPGKLCSELGISRGILSDLKAGRTKKLSAENVAKISAYFGVSTDYLLGNVSDPFFHLDNDRILREINSYEEEKPLVNDDKELTEYLEILKTRPEMRMLFRLSKDATKEDVEAAVRIIEALRKK